jgi:uncharacterized RDD family membrane protein YckC
MSTTDLATPPDPVSAPALFDGLLTRRVFAYFIDLVMLGMLATVIVFVGVIAGFFTFGLGWLLLPMVLPLAILGYYAVTLGSPMRATVGMSMMDIVLTPTRSPLDGWTILIHPLIFWITIWVAWPFILVPLFTQRRQMLHDLVTGTLMLRKSPMRRHWAAAGA